MGEHGHGDRGGRTQRDGCAGGNLQAQAGYCHYRYPDAGPGRTGADQAGQGGAAAGGIHYYQRIPPFRVRADGDPLWGEGLSSEADQKS